MAASTITKLNGGLTCSLCWYSMSANAFGCRTAAISESNRGVQFPYLLSLEQSPLSTIYWQFVRGGGEATGFKLLIWIENVHTWQNSEMECSQTPRKYCKLG